MTVSNIRSRWIAIGIISCVVLLGLAGVSGALAQASEPRAPLAPIAFDAPTTSSPISMDAPKNLIWVVNPDDDSVSVIGNLNSATPSVIAKFNVGNEPQSVAIDTNNVDSSKYHVYVANAADNSVTVINVTNSTGSSVTAAIQTTLTTGAEPWNVIASPNGNRVYVANSGQDTITVINTTTTPPSIIGNVTLNDSACNSADPNRHFEPRGMAVTFDNTKLYVTRFLSFVKPGGVQGDDNGKEGLVCRLDINTASGTIGGSVTSFTPITLASRNTGFAIDKNGDTIPDATFAYPNQLQSIVIRGDRAYLPNIAGSPSGPLKFNVDTQAFVNQIGGVTSNSQTDLGALNLHLGARDPEPGKLKLFFANPWAIGFSTPSGAGNAYVVSAGSDLLVKLNVDATGTITFTGDFSTTRYIDLNSANNGNAGKNPLGIVVRNIAADNNKAYVMNYVSRNVSVVNLATDSVAQVIALTTLPTPGTQEEQIHVGKEMFFSSRGHFNRPAGTSVSTENRLSSEGWQNCASCHFAGLTDGNVWAFGAGPRKSVPLNGTWSPHNPDDQRVLNYSAIFDEVEDFELNIRNVSGPGALAAPIAGSTIDPNHGLLISDTGNINFAPSVINAFALANAGRQQLSVTLPGSATAWPALTALREWVRFGIRTPNSMLTAAELTAGGGNSTGGLSATEVAQGRRLFFQAGCQACHGGTKWTISSKDFTSPPAASEIAVENPPVATTVNTQYLKRFLENIDSFNLGVLGQGNPIGSNIGAIEKAADGRDGLGVDVNSDGAGEGFNVPSLLGIWNVQPYYHNGACETLACVMSNVTHRTSGLRPGQPDQFTSGTNRNRVISFLQSLDAETIFPTNLRIDRHDIFVDPPTVFSGTQVIVGANVSLFGARADLEDPLQVRFTAPGLNTQVALPVSAFSQDFGQATITTTWNVPNTPGLAVLTVQVDSDDVQIEANENDNTATRRIRIFAPPPDRTPPVVQSVRISDDNPFNENDPIVSTANVQVKLRANDPDPAGPETPSGLARFCIVRYYFDSVTRRWVEQTCVFERLPAAQLDGSFIINATIPARAGTAYAFVWVKDAAGNISRTPGFDAVSFIPGPTTNINLNRNDVRVFRVLLTPGQQLTFDFDILFGDVDVSVFDGIGVNATRIALSANNGTVDESVTVAVPGNGANTTFQIEVRAVVNSRFRISSAQTLANVQTISAWPADVNAPTKDLPTTPFIGGPPALQTAIGDEEVYLPIVIR